MIEKTACFVGHGAIFLEMESHLMSRIDVVVRNLIGKGYTEFVSGGSLGFSMLASRVIVGLKKEYPQIRLHLVLPCRTQTKGWNWFDVETFQSILSNADSVKYISNRYRKGCMQKRNRRVVDMSSVCVCYLTHSISETAYTVSYASSKGLKIINVAQ